MIPTLRNPAIFRNRAPCTNGETPQRASTWFPDSGFPFFPSIRLQQTRNRSGVFYDSASHVIPTLREVKHRTKIAEEIRKIGRDPLRRDTTLSTRAELGIGYRGSDTCQEHPPGSHLLSRDNHWEKLMRFIVQRRSDGKYNAANGDWVESEKEAKLFWTQVGAEAFCFTQNHDDSFYVSIRMPTGHFVRLNQAPLRPTGVPSKV